MWQSLLVLPLALFAQHYVLLSREGQHAGVAGLEDEDGLAMLQTKVDRDSFSKTDQVSMKLDVVQERQAFGNTPLALFVTSRHVEKDRVHHLGEHAFLKKAVLKEPPASESVVPPPPASAPEKIKPPNIALVTVATLVSAAVVAIVVFAGNRVYVGDDENAVASRSGLDLAACFALIIIFFCSYGIAQEYIMTETYGDEMFPNTTFLIMGNRIVICIVSGSILLATKESVNLTVAKFCVIPSATVLISSFAQYECLHYVTFPTQVVFKSAKIVPTMALNTVVNRVWMPASDYILAIVITCCVAGFSLIAESAKSSAGTSNSFYGIVLLCLFLACDALTSNTEKWIYNKDKTFTNTQMMFAMGVITLIYSAIATATTSGGFPAVFGFVGRHPECIPQILVLAMNSTFGQYVIYYTVRKHGPVSLAIMMTVRQIISVFVSAVLYNHNIPIGAALFAAAAFAACLWKPFYKYFTSGTAKAKEESGGGGH